MKIFLKTIDLKSGFCDPQLPAWVIAIIAAVVVIIGFIAWIMTH